MYKDKRILAVIPARGGSKGIPGKNIIDLCGKPLIAYSIESALACPYVDRVIVSTDSEEIQKVALRHGADVPFLRPAKLATDTAKTIDALLHAIETLKNQGDIFDYLLLLQPTQPIREDYHLTEAIETLIESGETSLVSVSLVTEHPLLMRTIDAEGNLKPLMNASSTVRRQDFPDVYKVNGNIYLNRLDTTFNSETSLNDNSLPYIMDSQYATDIDSPQDLLRAEQQIKKRISE